MDTYKLGIGLLVGVVLLAGAGSLLIDMGPDEKTSSEVLTEATEDFNERDELKLNESYELRIGGRYSKNVINVSSESTYAEGKAHRRLNIGQGTLVDGERRDFSVRPAEAYSENETTYYKTRDDSWRRTVRDINRPTIRNLISNLSSDMLTFEERGETYVFTGTVSIDSVFIEQLDYRLPRSTTIYRNMIQSVEIELIIDKDTYTYETISFNGEANVKGETVNEEMGQRIWRPDDTVSIETFTRVDVQPTDNITLTEPTDVFQTRANVDFANEGSDSVEVVLNESYYADYIWVETNSDSATFTGGVNQSIRRSAGPENGAQYIYAEPSGFTGTGRSVTVNTNEPTTITVVGEVDGRTSVIKTYEIS